MCQTGCGDRVRSTWRFLGFEANQWFQEHRTEPRIGPTWTHKLEHAKLKIQSSAQNHKGVLGENWSFRKEKKTWQTFRAQQNVGNLVSDGRIRINHHRFHSPSFLITFFLDDRSIQELFRCVTCRTAFSTWILNLAELIVRALSEQMLQHSHVPVGLNEVFFARFEPAGELCPVLHSQPSASASDGVSSCCPDPENK